MNNGRRNTMMSRRGFFGTAAVLAGATAISGRAQTASLPEAPTTTTTTMQPPIFPTSGPDYQPVVTLNGWTLPWRQNGDWKEFHLVCRLLLEKKKKKNDDDQAPQPTTSHRKANDQAKDKSDHEP